MIHYFNNVESSRNGKYQVGILERKVPEKSDQFFKKFNNFPYQYQVILLTQCKKRYL